MHGFSPVSATVGGALIGLAAGLLWIVNGRVAGIAAIFGSLVWCTWSELPWRLLFLAGLPLGAAIGRFVGGNLLPDMPQGLPDIDSAPSLLLVSGALVGAGAALARGCTSTHGVFGLANLSLRSTVTVGIFVATAALTVLVARQFS